jgi:hypothetical protein
MTDYYLDAEDIISDFLRVKLTDPRSRAEATETQTFNPSLDDTDITLSAPTSGSVSCVTSVTVDGTAKKKWREYYWDYQNRKLIFYTSFAGTEEVIITYKYGTTNWIYSDKPDEELSANSFPRISLFSVSGTGRRVGNYEAPMQFSPVLQIDIWSKDGYLATYDSRKYSNNYLTRFLGNQIIKYLEDSEEDLFPVLYDCEIINGPRVAPYSYEYQAFHSVVEVTFNGINLGRIKT